MTAEVDVETKKNMNRINFSLKSVYMSSEHSRTQARMHARNIREIMFRAPADLLRQN